MGLRVIGRGVLEVFCLCFRDRFGGRGRLFDCWSRPMTLSMQRSTSRVFGGNQVLVFGVVSKLCLF